MDLRHNLLQTIRNMILSPILASAMAECKFNEEGSADCLALAHEYHNAVKTEEFSGSFDKYKIVKK